MTSQLATHLLSAARIIEIGGRYRMVPDDAIRFALDVLAIAEDAPQPETGDREPIRRASLPAARIDGAAGESPDEGQDESAAAADAHETASCNPGKSVRNGEGGDALPEPDDARTTTTDRVIALMNEGFTETSDIAERAGITVALASSTVNKVRLRRDPRLTEFALGEPPPLPADRLFLAKGKRLIGPGGFIDLRTSPDPRWLCLMEALAAGQLMFLPDIAPRGGVKANDARDLLSSQASIERLRMIGLRLAWQGKEMLRLETIPLAKD